MLVLAMQFSKSAERPTPKGRPKEHPKVLLENGTEMSNSSVPRPGGANPYDLTC